MRPSRLVRPLIVLSLALGCSSSAPDKLGRRIAQNVFDPSGGLGHVLVWSADGSEIFYLTTGGPNEIRAARADGLGSRVVQPQIGQQISALVAPPDTSALYFLAGVATVGQALPQMRTLAPAPTVAVIVVASGDDVHLASGAFIYDTVQATTISATLPTSGCCWWTAVFSPAGDQLFVMNASLGLGTVVDLAGNPVGSPLSLSVNPQAGQGYPAGMQAASWNDGGIRVLEGVPANQIENVTTGALTPLVVPDGFQLGYVDYVTWSRDGTQVGFTAYACTPDEPATDASVCVADAASGVTRTIASGADLTFGDIAFSPDGARIAYVVHGDPATRSDLYVIDVPPSATP